MDLDSYSILFLIKPVTNNIPELFSEILDGKGIRRDLVKNTFILINLISLTSWSNVIVSSTEIVILVSANITGKLAYKPFVEILIFLDTSSFTIVL